MRTSSPIGQGKRKLEFERGFNSNEKQHLRSQFNSRFMSTQSNQTKINPNNMSVVQRIKAPTPKFFRTLRTIGLTLAAIGGAILTSPILLPASLITAAGYVAIAGGIVSAISQTAVDNNSASSNNETL